MRLLNEKCAKCDMCSEVTETITGVQLEKTYYQCLADIESDCLGGEPIEKEYSILDVHEAIKSGSYMNLGRLGTLLVLRTYFEDRWNNGGGFIHKICEAIVVADTSNLIALHRAYPILVEGYISYGTGRTWSEFLNQ